MKIFNFRLLSSDFLNFSFHQKLANYYWGTQRSEKGTHSNLRSIPTLGDEVSYLRKIILQTPQVYQFYFQIALYFYVSSHFHFFSRPAWNRAFFFLNCLWSLLVYLIILIIVLLLLLLCIIHILPHQRIITRLYSALLMYFR